MIDKFDPYELIAVVAPGSILVFGAVLLYPAVRASFGLEGIDLGGLGLFVILSFVAGHLVQTIGNLFETLIWRLFGGMPTSWVLQPYQSLLERSQLKRLRQACAREFGVEMAQLHHRSWNALTREIYAAVKKHGTTGRIDAFNRTYGFMRGIGSAFLVLAVATFLRDPHAWNWSLAGIATAGLAFYRMVRFGERYGRELLVEFIRLTPDEAPTR